MYRLSQSFVCFAFVVGLTLFGCSGSRNTILASYSGYEVVEHQPSRASGSTLGWRYGPALQYHRKLIVHGNKSISAGLKYTWLNSKSTRTEVKGTKEDPTNPHELTINGNFHFIEPLLTATYMVYSRKGIAVDGHVYLAYSALFAGRFKPQDADGNNYFPSDRFNSSHGRLRGSGWKVGLGLGGDCAISEESRLGLVFRYDVFDNTVLKEYFGGRLKHDDGDLVYKPRNAFSIGLRYTF